jgi:hypothetical protein
MSPASDSSLSKESANTVKETGHLRVEVNIYDDQTETKIEKNKNKKIKNSEQQEKNATIDEQQQQRMRLRKLFEEINLKQPIRNRHFIDHLLNSEEKLLSFNESFNNIPQPQLQTETTINKDGLHFYKTPKFLIILVQIHSRIKYLDSLIESLRNTKYIEQTLVIFSHDIYDEEMNKLINEKVDFCAVSNL